jgi:hypothetical protein
MNDRVSRLRHGVRSARRGGAWIKIRKTTPCKVEWNPARSAFGAAFHPPSSTRVTSQTPRSSASALTPKSQFPAHFQHHGIFLQNLAVDAAQALEFCVFDDQLHQGPAQAPALEIRSQQDRVLAGPVAFIAVQPDNAEYLAAGFIQCDKGHRARIVQLRQARDELRREFLDGIEEAKPQVCLADMDQKVANQGFVAGSERPDKYPPVIPEYEMPLPLRIVQTKRRHPTPQGNCYGCIRSAATRYFLAWATSCASLG